MKKSLFSVPLVVGLIMLAGCKKTSLVSEETAIASTARVSSTTVTTERVCDVITFQGSQEGTIITSVMSEGGRGPIAITSFNPRFPLSNVSMIFNSANPEPQPGDKWSVDMGTPNEAFNGPGIGAAGAAGSYINDKSLYNMILMQDLDYAYPREDVVLGFIAFNFSSVGKVAATSLTVIDIDGQGDGIEWGKVELYSAEGGSLLETIDMPYTGENGVGIIDLKNTKDVGYIKLIIKGSMAFDNLRFCIEPPQNNQCTHTWGYWKTHGPVPNGNNTNKWTLPTGTMTLGDPNNINHQYTDMELLAIFDQPVAGNGLIALAHQLIAAKLNINDGASSAAIQSTITEADNLIKTISQRIPPHGDGYLKPSTTSILVDKLTQYNEGRLLGGPQHCN